MKFNKETVDRLKNTIKDSKNPEGYFTTAYQLAKMAKIDGGQLSRIFNYKTPLTEKIVRRIIKNTPIRGEYLLTGKGNPIDKRKILILEKKKLQGFLHELDIKSTQQGGHKEADSSTTLKTKGSSKMYEGIITDDENAVYFILNGTIHRIHHATGLTEHRVRVDDDHYKWVATSESETLSDTGDSGE